MFLVMGLSNTDNNNPENVSNTLIGNDSIGSVYVEGPYGNENS